MRKILISVIVIVILIVAFYFIKKEKVVVPVITPAVTTPSKTETSSDNTTRELCFAKFGKPNSYGDSDMYTLRMDLTGGNVKGELNLLPAEKDKKTGEIEGTVGAVDKVMMARTADLWWFTSGEGMEVKEQLKIIFGEGTASIGMGEMVDRGDGVYVYKDPKNISYTLNLTDVACLDLIKRANVIEYLQDNISILSPVKAVLGGTWFVDSETINLTNNSGVVTYEDGHIQEVKNFTYVTDAKGQVVSLKIVDPPKTTACTQEAKICPDGSAVGRTGPNCDFAACPK